MKHLHHSYSPFLISSTPSSTPLLQSPGQHEGPFGSQKGLRCWVTWASPTGAKRVKDLEDTAIKVSISYSNLLFSLYRRYRRPVLLLLTQSKHRAGGGIRMKGTGVLRHACCIKKPPVSVGRLVCERTGSCWEISPCPSASDSSLYCPARPVHHPPPPASPTILHPSCWGSCLFVPWLVLCNWHAGRRWLLISLNSNPLFRTLIRFSVYSFSCNLLRLYGTLRKFVFASNCNRNAVYSSYPPGECPRELFDSLFLVAFAPPIEIKVMRFSLKATSPGASTCCFHL